MIDKVDHVEVSEGNTIIVSSSECPLSESELVDNQKFIDVPVCKHKNIREKDFVCVDFYGVVFHEMSFKVRCNYKNNQKGE